MKVKCIKIDRGTPPYADIEVNKVYEVFTIKQNIVSREFLIKDASKKRKWYEECLFEEVKDV